MTFIYKLLFWQFYSSSSWQQWKNASSFWVVTTINKRKSPKIWNVRKTGLNVSSNGNSITSMKISYKQVISEIKEYDTFNKPIVIMSLHHLIIVLFAIIDRMIGSFYFAFTQESLIRSNCSKWLLIHKVSSLLQKKALVASIILNIKWGGRK